MVANQKLKLFLPFGLALFIPLLGNIVDGIEIDNANFIRKWALSSFYILSLWHALLVARHRKSERNKNRNILLTLVFVSLLVLVHFFFKSEKVQAIHWTVVIRLSFSFLVIYLIQYALYTQDKMTELQVEREQLQNENLKIQLKELRNQMDPHFFFNSLNTLRSMVRQNHENSEQFIIGLSDFYRQLLKHQKNTMLSLSEELTVLKSYLFLMKNRNEKALQTEIEEIDKKYDEYTIPTLALQSVVENCFKHNIMSSKMPLKINIRTTEDGYLEVTNNIQPKLTPQESSGIGLNLLKKRYQLIKVENGVIVNSDMETFAVKLKLIPAP